MSLQAMMRASARVATRAAHSTHTLQRTAAVAAASLPIQSRRATFARAAPAGSALIRRSFSTAASSSSSAAAQPSSSSASAAAAPDADPVNPEDYARLHGFTDDDEGDAAGAGGETPYREADADPARTALCDRILSAALPLAAESGEWGLPVLRRAASSLGLSSASVGMLGSDPAAELVWAAMRKAHDEMSAKYAAQLAAQPDLARAPTSQRLHRALQLRQQALTPYLSSWAAALALVSSSPCALKRTLSLHAAQISDVWHLVGDSSTDPSWYLKRGLLSGVAVSTELFWITDRSAGQQATWRFLERQLDCARTVAAMPDSVGQATTVLGNIGARLFATAAQAK